jgi:peptidoglycan/xylan/chitin deacetylase (PgdA/CDA1 family)
VGSPQQSEASEGPACEGSGFAWPEGKKAAVALTYDDGLPSQLSNAVPALEQNGFVATFFLSENYSGFEQRKAKYQELHQKGFELAAHTVRHPCFGLTPELASLDRATVEKELDDNIATLRALGVAGPLTFAYPCGNTEYGTPRTSYVPEIEARFVAARGVNCCALGPSAVNLYDVNTYWPPADATAATITAPIDEAIVSGAFLVYGFHAVGNSPGEWSAVPQVAHDALVAYLAQKKSDVWVTTFGEAASYVKRCR